MTCTQPDMRAKRLLRTALRDVALAATTGAAGAFVTWLLQR